MLVVVCMGAIAHVFGRRSKKTLRKLLGLLSGFNVAFWCTDNFSTYEMLPDIHRE